MEKLKHTPGKWVAKDGQIYPESTGKTLGLIPYFDKGNEEQVANAMLMAAAPELLHALMAIVESYNVRIEDPRRKHFDAARDAIAEAIRIE